MAGGDEGTILVMSIRGCPGVAVGEIERTALNERGGTMVMMPPPHPETDKLQSRS
jgi:hypothetical protein